LEVLLLLLLLLLLMMMDILDIFVGPDTFLRTLENSFDHRFGGRLGPVQLKLVGNYILLAYHCRTYLFKGIRQESMPCTHCTVIGEATSV
jgi:hypothetical protein